MIKDYNNTAYLSVKKLRSSEVPREALRALQAWDALQLQVCKPRKIYSLYGAQMQWVIVGMFFFVQAYLKPLLAKLIG